MTNKVIACALIFGLGFLGACSAFGFDLSFVGGADFATPSVQQNGSNVGGYSDKAAFGGGMLLGLDLNLATELEIGALYMGRHFSFPGGEHNYHSYEIPLVIRLIPLKYITFGVGPYYAVVTDQDSAAGVPATTHFQNDFGFLGSLAFKFPLSLATCFLVDTRYLYGVTNASRDSGTSLHYRDVQILAGLNFGF